jgi:hypothetical protein
MLDEAEIRGMARALGFEGGVHAQVVVTLSEGGLFSRLIVPLDQNMDGKVLALAVGFEMGQALKALRKVQARERKEAGPSS